MGEDDKSRDDVVDYEYHICRGDEVEAMFAKGWIVDDPNYPMDVKDPLSVFYTLKREKRKGK